MKNSSEIARPNWKGAVIAVKSWLLSLLLLRRFLLRTLLLTQRVCAEGEKILAVHLHFKTVRAKHTVRAAGESFFIGWSLAPICSNISACNNVTINSLHI